MYLFMFLGLASRYSSYVAVDPKANVPLEGWWMMMKSRDIPVQYDDDDEDDDEDEDDESEYYNKPLRGGGYAMEKKQSKSFSANSVSASESEGDDESDNSDKSKPMTHAASKLLSDDKKLRKLVDGQSFNGAFRLDPSIAELLDTTLDEVKQGM